MPSRRIDYGREGATWHRFAGRLKEEAGRRCERCHRPGRLEVHHKVPVAKGGPVYARSNLLVLCRTCHLGEHRRTVTRNPQILAWLEAVAALEGQAA